MAKSARPPSSASRPRRRSRSSAEAPEALQNEAQDEAKNESEEETQEESPEASLDEESFETESPPEDGEIRDLPALREPELAAISPQDPLRRYLDEVRRHPLLEPEEEFRLAQKLRDQGDIDAAKALVAANLRLVVKIAFEYRTLYANVLDLIQEGNVGLMKAVSKFDPARGARLGYYASWWIRSYILKYLLDNFRLVKIGTTQAQKKLFYHLMKEKQRLEAQGLLAGPKLLAERLEVREKDVIEMSQRLSHQGGEISLDAPIDPENGGQTRLEHMPDEHEGADDSLAREQLVRLLKEKLPEFEKELNAREKQLLQDRLMAEEPKTLQEVADHYGLTRERARQIEAKVLQKLRKFLAPHLGEELPD